jgi:Immunity protein 35
MLSFEDARKIAAEYIQEGKANSNGLEMLITDEHTIEKPYCWVFYYNSKKWLETKNVVDLIAGNSPMIIDKVTGKVTRYYSSVSVSEALKKYESEIGYSA